MSAGATDGLGGDIGRAFASASFVIGLVIVAFWTGCAIFGPSLIPYDPYADDMLNSLAPPTAEHWFGTDQLGRDIYAAQHLECCTLHAVFDADVLKPQGRMFRLSHQACSGSRRP